MVDFVSIVTNVAGKVALNRLLDFLQGNKSQLQKAYEKAFEESVRWYEQKYGDNYGTKNNRFFNYARTEKELAKLLLLRPAPDLELISNIKLPEGKTTPPEVVQAFVLTLRQEMAKIRECEAIFVEREKLTIYSEMNAGIKELLNLKKKSMGLEKEVINKPIEPDPTPINWQELERMFREEYRLDRLDYGHLGTTRDHLEQKLDLQKVYIALNVKDRSFDKIRQAANVETLSPLQQKNLPLLFQRFDDLLHLELEKDMRIFHEEKEAESGQIASKVLKECSAQYLRDATVIIADILQELRIKRDILFRVLWSLSSAVFVPRPLAELPAINRCFLLIGDAGGGKSTACRYLALRCFADLNQPEARILEKEFAMTDQSVLPVYLRLEDFSTLIDKFADDTCCLFECAAKFWQRNNNQVFHAGQLYHVMLHQPVWLFLDGLDEISNPTHRKRLVTVVHKLVSENKFPQLRLLLSSRPAAITDELLNELDIPYYTLLNLEQRQIEDFAHKYFAANLALETSGEIKQRADELVTALDNVPAAKRLAFNPLLLTVIAVLHYKEGKLPQHRAELYEKCIEQLMAQKATIPGKPETGKITFKYPRISSKPTIDWNYNEIIDMLRDLAFYAFSRKENEALLNQDLLLQRLQQSDLVPPQKKTSNELEDAARYFLDECDRLIGLLAFRGGHYVFVHRTFHEYLAAHWLCMQKEAEQKERLLAMLENPSHWHEVIRLFFNRLGKTNPNFGEELVELLTAKAMEIQNVELIQLSALCLYDFEEYQRRYKLHDKIKNSLFDVRNRSFKKPEIFLCCGDALALICEPEIDPVNPPMIELDANQPFKMGGNEYSQEKPVHEVRLSPFWMSTYPVTNKQFAEFIKSGGYRDENFWLDKNSLFPFDAISFFNKLQKKQPEYWLDERFGRNRSLAPVAGVSWYEAMAYCRWWNVTIGEIQTEKSGLLKGSMRLPSEAEWEYACRAGTETPFNTGENLTTELANYNGNYPWKNFPKSTYLQRTTSVGSYPPNAWGLFDMHGNVFEWCLDWYDEKFYEQCSRQGLVENPVCTKAGSYRGLRGGCWYDGAGSCRSAFRGWYLPDGRDSSIGFRLVFVPQSVGS